MSSDWFQRRIGDVSNDISKISAGVDKAKREDIPDMQAELETMLSMIKSLRDRAVQHPDTYGDFLPKLNNLETKVHKLENKLASKKESWWDKIKKSVNSFVSFLAALIGIIVNAVNMIAGGGDFPRLPPSSDN